VASVGLKGAPPYKEVVTHGFVVDAEGRKMSKSVGNVITPDELLTTYGADILRLWTAMVDFREDVRISEEIMTRNAEAYRKIRNTLRFLLGNLADFDPVSDIVRADELTGLDAYMLHATERLAADVIRAYQGYELASLSHRILNFSTVDLSSLYLDVNKDRLYCDHPEDPGRRATQTVIYRIAQTLATLLAPVLSFTAEEVWQHLPGEREESVHLATLSVPEKVTSAESEAEAPIRRLLALRDVVLAELEELRQAGSIGKSEEARMLFAGDSAALLEDLESTGIDLAKLLILSDARQGVVEGGGTEITAYPGLRVAVGVYEGHTCSRCWRRVEEPVEDDNLPGLCPRCHEVVSRLLEEGRVELGEVDG
jgi:isoleucyl-tRNA synthetase